MNIIKEFSDLPVSLRVDDLTSLLRISRNTAFKLTKDPTFPSVRVGDSKRIIIPRDRLIKWLNDKADQPL